MYWWTPHGRQGSKLRTARMMSIPLNWSGPFSSKIGVPWHESSYGPGVPAESRGDAFHGVGGDGGELGSFPPRRTAWGGGTPRTPSQKTPGEAPPAPLY